MKKVLAAIAIVAVAACFVSCKKTCTCITTVNGVQTNKTETQATNCSDMNSTSNTVGVVTKTECN